MDLSFLKKRSAQMNNINSVLNNKFNFISSMKYLCSRNIIKNIR